MGENEKRKRGPESECPESESNRDAYNAIAARWDAARVGFVLRERDYLDTLLDGLEGARVLDLGCGTGRPIAEHVLARGHELVGVDQSEALLKIAAARFPQARWVHGRIEDGAWVGPCDAVVLWDSLFHIHRRHHERILSRVAASLRPRGRAMLTVGGSAHPAFTDTMLGETFFYDSLPPGEVLAILERLELAPVISEFMNPPTTGRDKGRFAIVAEKAGAEAAPRMERKEAVP